MFRLLICLSVLLAASSVFPEEAEALSCSRRIISTGDSDHRVVSLCGEPTSKTTRVVERSVYVRGPAGGVFSESVSVLVETWIYDFGPRRLTQRLTFEDGVLVRVQTGRAGVRQRAR